MERVLQDLKNQADSVNPDHREGSVAAFIEEYTAKLPSDLFLWGALGSMAVSLAFKLAKKDDLSLFFANWPAPLLLFGVYNKIVKELGHDREDVRGERAL
jgi:hypothetical protein